MVAPKLDRLAPALPASVLPDGHGRHTHSLVFIYKISRRVIRFPGGLAGEALYPPLGGVEPMTELVKKPRPPEEAIEEALRRKGARKPKKKLKLEW